VNQSRKTVNIKILDKDYQVACSPDEEVLLSISARHLDDTMRNIRSTGKVVGSDRIAVMAALNVTNDLLHGKNTPSTANPLQDEQIQRMSRKIDEALQQYRQLQL
jgi:cell division protein ZapA